MALQGYIARLITTYICLHLRQILGSNTMFALLPTLLFASCRTPGKATMKPGTNESKAYFNTLS